MTYDQLLRRLRDDDRGVAIATVALLGLAVVMMTSVMTLRGTRQVNNTSSDGQWEQSLHVAEAGLADVITDVKADDTYTTGQILPTFDDADAERAWAVQVADGLPSADLITTPEGEYAVIVPAGEQVIYSVGFTPARDAAERRVRTVRVTYERIPGALPYYAAKAFVTNGHLSISGSPTAFESNADVHANGDLDVSGNPTTHDACLTASGLATVDGNVNDHASCEGPSYQPLEVVPDIVPRDFWPSSEYDLCPNGEVRAGPAYGGAFAADPNDAPCTGDILEADAGASPYLGWQYLGYSSIDGHVWEYGTNVENHGSYYVFQGSASIPTGPGTNTNPWRISLVAEAEGACDAHVGGDIVLTGAAVVTPHETAGTLFMIAGRDVVWDGNGRLKEKGIIGAVEQIAIIGNPVVLGSFIAAEACDTAGDLVDVSEIAGNPKFELDGEVETIWEYVGSEGSVAVVAWDEL
ncbi:MAG: hypothetical protein R3290_03925 [Acidimicrobiia bacterium]|nr:hypothetical protein [Acidimicrobiia bacterium]